MWIWRIIMANRRTRKPTHPGELIREDLLPETGLSQTKLAHLMGVSRRTVSEIVNERRRLTSDMAFRLARVFKSTPEMFEYAAGSRFMGSPGCSRP